MGHKKSPRIVIYVRAISGGAGKNAVKYANILAEHGNDVILTCGHAPSLNQYIPDPSVQLEVFGTKRNLSAVAPLRRILAQHNPDICLVVDASNLPAMLLSLSACPSRPKLILREALSTWERTQMRGLFMRKFKWLVHKVGYRQCDLVIALTQQMVTELRRHWGVPENRIVLIPNGIRVEKHPDPVRNREANRIVCVARLEEQKDIATLLRAFAILRQNITCKLSIAGTGRLEKDLKTLTRTLEIEGDVDFLGHVDDTETLYASAHLAVLPSLWEGFPNVVIEALAQGTPVVATRIPGAVEILENSGAGLLCKIGDPHDLAAKILQALSQDWDKAAIQNRAYHFSNEKLEERVLEAVKPDTILAERRI